MSRGGEGEPAGSPMLGAVGGLAAAEQQGSRSKDEQGAPDTGQRALKATGPSGRELGAPPVSISAVIVVVSPLSSSSSSSASRSKSKSSSDSSAVGLRVPVTDALAVPLGLEESLGIAVSVGVTLSDGLALTDGEAVSVGDAESEGLVLSDGEGEITSQLSLVKTLSSRLT